MLNCRLEARSTECLTSSKQIPPPGGLGQPLKPLNSIVTDNNNLYSHVNHNSSQYSTQQPQATVSSISDKVLSVSGKKKCSHCGDELGKYSFFIFCKCFISIIFVIHWCNSLQHSPTINLLHSLLPLILYALSNCTRSSYCQQMVDCIQLEIYYLNLI